MIGQKVVEDAISEVKKLHKTTLDHALSISPLIGARSIGPDIKDDAVKSEAMTKKEKNLANTKKSPPKEYVKKEKCPPTHPDFNSLQNLGFQAINSSILLREAEEARKRSIRQQVFEIQEKHLAKMQECLKPIELHNQEERRKWLEKKRQDETEIIQKAEQQSALDHKEFELEIEALRKQTQRHLQLVSFQGISQYQSEFRSKYESIVNLLMSIDKASLVSCNEYNRKLKEFIQMFEQLIAKIKCGDCGSTEMKTAENLCKSLADLEHNIIDDLKIETERQESVAREKEEKIASEQRAAEAEAQNRKSELPAVESTEQNCNTSSTEPKHQLESISQQHVSQQCMEFYTKTINFYQEKVDRVKVLQSDETMKKYRFDCQKSINIPINAISAVSPQHLQDKFDKLQNFVMSQPALGRDYCILLMAKKFVGQGETTISSNPQAAFPVASVLVSLWKQIPDFGQLFLAYCFKECPFLVPYFIPQKKDQSPEEYSKVLGFRIVDGQPEKQDMYLKRQSGIARLYAAVMVTNGRQHDGPTHPYGLENAWRWLTNIVDITPLPHLSATLIMEILQIVGCELWNYYGKQFVKLLVYIQQYYFPSLSEVDAGGPKARLELLLNNFLREGKIPKPNGMLQPGFW